MKDYYQQRWKPDCKNSVIASLMGFDELQPKPSIHGKRRGLSENYLRNSASIGLWQGSLVYVRRSCSVDSDDSHRFVDSRSSSESGNEGRKSNRRNDEHCAKRVLRRQQKLEYDLHHLGDLGIASQLEMIDSTRRLSTSIRAFKPSPEKVYELKDDELDVHCDLGYRESPKSCNVCSQAMNRISQQERCRSKFEGVLRYGNHSHHPHSLLDRSSLANESKKRKNQRWKMGKKVQEFGDSRRKQTLSQMLALADQDHQVSKPRISDVELGRTCLRNPNSGSSSPLSSLPVSDCEEVKDLSSGWDLEQTTSKNDNLESKSGRGSEQFHISLGVDETMSPDSKVSELSSCSFSCFGLAFNNPEAYILGIRDEMDNSFGDDFGKDDELTATVGVSSITSGDSESESNLCTKMEESGRSSAIEEVFNKEASLDEVFEEESASPNFSAVVPPDSLEYLKRTNQHSPDSVLESFHIKSSSFEWLDSTGLRLQLESLNFDSRETCSEGSVMDVSGDEDVEEEFGSRLCHDRRIVKRWLGDGESRTYSYMVDVLDEAGFCGMNSYMDLKMWYSLEYPINPLLFETLEKKYGKQASWQKSERQLLFDRINCGLLEIFNPILNVHADTTSLRRRLCASFRLDEVVDELWTKLVSQEEEVTKGLLEKAVDKWLELEEGIDIICRELEASLFDELAMEFASLLD